jgi:hypothetical protein
VQPWNETNRDLKNSQKKALMNLGRLLKTPEETSQQDQEKKRKS